MEQLIAERERIAKSLGIVKCDHCSRLCPYCPRLMEVRPDLNRVAIQSGSTQDRYPSIWKQVKNVTGAIVEHVAAGLPQVNNETFTKRMSICLSCEHFDPAWNRCRICGCKTEIKLRWAEQHCPVKKW